MTTITGAVAPDISFVLGFVRIINSIDFIDFNFIGYCRGGTVYGIADIS
ncbi:MAG: hypothetical protein V1688_00770 [bacterium]